MNRLAHRGSANCGLHPLIHTFLEFTLAQDIESISKRSRSSAVFFGKWIVDYLLGKPTRANRKKTTKTKVLVSDRMVAPEAA